MFDEYNIDARPLVVVNSVAQDERWLSAFRPHLDTLAVRGIGRLGRDRHPGRQRFRMIELIRKVEVG